MKCKSLLPSGETHLSRIERGGPQADFRFPSRTNSSHSMFHLMWEIWTKPLAAPRDPSRRAEAASYACTAAICFPRLRIRIFS